MTELLESDTMIKPLKENTSIKTRRQGLVLIFTSDIRAELKATFSQGFPSDIWIEFIRAD